MKTRWMVTLLLIASVVWIGGCSKKEKPAPPAEPEAQEAPGMMNSMKKAADKAVTETMEAANEATEAVKESFTVDIDLEKAVADLKAEAAKMDVETLTKIAMKYKDAIVEKQAALQPLMDKLAAVPAAEKMGAEAQKMMTEIKALTDAIAPLKERFRVYVDAIKAKSGDVTNLTL